MKREIYITLFTVLGILVSFMLHAFLEILYISFLVRDFDTYSLGLSFAGLEVAHIIFTATLLLSGVVVGFKQGVYWWRRIYERGRVRALFTSLFGKR